ncbi:M15 family metallopeptidase [Cellulomonas sp. HD19AZ1]|uniref:M15 family metallopeptidase n=1 Tax=Cellulomonas sp. HD19AZ1 TaxID=2559593 RepID=UPI001070E146|nr:M15 family metallopeptidase [Cellulomonas sp. HD19AZ1]TFH69932.1 M15 family peptidase [Cellulomonas sp. HD19AZ1]
MSNRQAAGRADDARVRTAVTTVLPAAASRRPVPPGGPRVPSPPPGRPVPAWAVTAGVLVVVVAMLVGLGFALRDAAADPAAGPVAGLAAADADGPVSQNGWPVILDPYDERLVALPGVTGGVRAGDVATVLGHVVARIDAEIAPVEETSSWGWAHREVRGGGDVSNHASGTAVDVNAPQHPMGEEGTFAPDELATLRSILEDVAPAVVWGGDFGGRKDEMHFEVVGGPDVVAEVAARLAAGG